MSELAQLVRMRGQVKGQLTRFRTFLDEFDSSGNIVKLESRLEKVERIWAEFNDLQSKIELLEDESDATSNERESFEEAFFDAVTDAKEFIKERTKTENSFSTINNSNTESLRNVKLPNLNLPAFSGEYQEWLPFHDSFKAIIHTNKELSNVQKLYYLKSCLKGAAAQVIHSLEITENNYEVAWKLLQTRFENKRLIVNNHVKALFEIPHISKEPNSSIRHLLDNMLKHLRALKSLNQPVEHWDTLTIYLISSKLDQVSRREWELKLETNDLPTLQQFEDFLTKRSQVTETLSNNKFQGKSSNLTGGTNNQFGKSLSYATTQKSPCPVCNKSSHQIFNCFTFKRLSHDGKLEQIKKHSLCLNCLRATHLVRDCWASGCKFCNKKHNSTLHIANTQLAGNANVVNKGTNEGIGTLDNSRANSELINESDVTSNKPQTGVVSLCTFKNKSTQVLLPTAIAYIQDKHGCAHECRILLDSGSQSNFITSELCKKLGLDTSRVDIPVGGISNSSTHITHRTVAVIQSKFDNYQVALPFLILSEITENLPLETVNMHQIKLPNNITLADNTFHLSGRVDVLLGSSIFWELICGEQLKLENQQAVVHKTKLGWIISGNITQYNYNNRNKVLCHFIKDDIVEQLEKFWKIEECERAVTYNKEERECEEHFVKTHKRDSNGRFIVSLPFKQDVQALGNSKQIALKRLYAMERKFKKQPELRSQYVQFMQEYQELGHMTKVADVDEHNGNIAGYYLPHHAVFKEGSTTTKLRVVFDGSCKPSSGVSLNENLKVGPTIQQDIFSIVTRFRNHRYVITADIAKMYRQVLIEEDQRSFQRIYWRVSPSQPITTFQLNTVTYGTATAPFLSVRCLHQVANENQSRYPEASHIIKTDFYVDDLLSGGDTIEKVRRIKGEISLILESAGFELRKWASNEEAVLRDQPTAGTESQVIGERETKTLGLLWDPASDRLRYRVECQQESRKTSKRVILSTIAQIYDPLGLIGPTTITAKVMLQQLWKLSIGWDDPVPDSLHDEWSTYRNQLQQLDQISISRHVVCEEAVHLQVHAFCDASERAFGACIYIRSTNNEGNHTVKLLCAKSRVAPLKKISLPRLELCGALLLSRLLNATRRAFHCPIDNIYCWSDSTITLAWIANQPSKWKTFVANRVTEIQELTSNAEWRHVRSEYNPADVISRGITPEQLKSNELWWNGPHWLAQNIDQWPSFQVPFERVEVPEERATTIALHSNHNIEIFQRYSSLSKLNRVASYCFRFRYNALNPSSKIKGPLTISELECSLICLIKVAQTQNFPTELKALSKNQPLHHSSKLISLNPFLDKFGVIRVGGRLKNANIPYDQKFPIVLASDHILTKLIIRHEHYRLLHAGPQYLLAHIRTKYWPLAGKSTIRKILRECIVCFRARPVSTEQLMSDLPKMRVTPARAFKNCGVDYAGPFNIKVSRNKTTKAYLCLFVCLATKAVHLELVSNLSTQAFLNALKRFISRRGRCSTISSDNGRNFIGAKRELAQLLSDESHKSNLYKYCLDEAIHWLFIPPHSPHHGGLWEAGVKSVKTHLNRIMGNVLLSFEELYTVFVQIEACLNSRPLSPLSSDPTDLTALTPGHFLIGEALTSLPQTFVEDTPVNRLTRYQLLSQLLQHFWSRWSREYLHHLQQRSKWKISKPNMVNPGTMVILKDDHLPPMKWQLARIVECFPGSDNLIRVVSVKTSNGVFKRPITRVCVLPTESN